MKLLITIADAALSVPVAGLAVREPIAPRCRCFADVGFTPERLFSCLQDRGSRSGSPSISSSEVGCTVPLPCPLSIKAPEASMRSALSNTASCPAARHKDHGGIRRADSAGACGLRVRALDRLGVRLRRRV